MNLKAKLVVRRPAFLQMTNNMQQLTYADIKNYSKAVASNDFTIVSPAVKQLERQAYMVAHGIEGTDETRTYMRYRITALSIFFRSLFPVCDYQIS